MLGGPAVCPKKTSPDTLPAEDLRKGTELHKVREFRRRGNETSTRILKTQCPDRWAVSRRYYSGTCVSGKRNLQVLKRFTQIETIQPALAVTRRTGFRASI